VSASWSDWVNFTSAIASGILNAAALLFYALLIDRADQFLSRRALEMAE
jgi:hypothetical protein